MQSVYLQVSDYGPFGAANATLAKVIQASTYIDAHLHRPEGLIWTPDAFGNPAYMAALTPSIELTLSAPIAPGANVVATVTGPLAGINIGDALIAETATPANTEAVVLTAKTGNTVTLGTVALAHAAGTKLSAGLGITERTRMPKNRPLCMLKRCPVQRVLAGKGRYAYGRRADAPSGNTDDFNLLAVYSQFGGPPAWEMFNPASTEFDPRTGDLWIPAGIMLAYYTEVEVTYVAGYSAATLPEPVKLACSKLILTLENDLNLGPAKSYRAGDTAIEKFSDTMISGDIANMLRPYRARAFA